MRGIVAARIVSAALAALVVFGGNAAFAQNGDCDRECLRSALTQYMNAVVANEPDEAGIIVGFRQTENAVAKRVGTGTWQSVTGLGEVQRHYLDPVSGQAAYFGLVEESGGAAIVTVRIKVIDRQITEAEWYIAREGMQGMAADNPRPAPFDVDYFIDNPPPAERTVPRRERLSRESLLGVTNSYFDAITAHDGNVMQIQPDCQRIENGLRVTGRPLAEGSTDGYQGRTICSSGIGPDSRLNIAFVGARRYPVVDEVQQVVLGLAVFLRNPESVNRRLAFSEYFVIEDGLIDEVYAAMFYADALLPVPNWPPYNSNFPLPRDLSTPR